MTRSSSLGFCQDTGRDQNNCALVGNTHIQVSPAICGGDQQRDWQKVRAQYTKCPKDNKDFPSAKHRCGKAKSEGRSVKEETALLEVVLTLTEDLPK